MYKIHISEEPYKSSHEPHHLFHLVLITLSHEQIPRQSFNVEAPRFEPQSQFSFLMKHWVPVALYTLMQLEIIKDKVK